MRVIKRTSDWDGSPIVRTALIAALIATLIAHRLSRAPLIRVDGLTHPLERGPLHGWRDPAEGERPRVPRVSVFYGIMISMYWDDHPPPHFHATYGGEEAKVGIDSLQVIAGSLSVAAYRRVRSWADLHTAELLANWSRGMAHEPFEQIEPLS